MRGFKINNLHIHFSGLVVLDKISFSIRQGEIFSLVGPNGSGKTTLFNCINGFNKPQKGEIKFNGVDILSLPSHKIIEAGISRTFQNLHTIPTMTVLDNVLLGNHIHIEYKETIKGLFSRNQREKEIAITQDVLDFLGIEKYAQKYINELPYGIQKLVEIARAIISRPKLILLDEPAAGMNEQETCEIAKIISEIRDEFGITVLLVEHDMSLVMAISDRVCVLDSGKILAIGTPPEVRQNPEVIKAFLGDGISA